MRSVDGFIFQAGFSVTRSMERGSGVFCDHSIQAGCRLPPLLAKVCAASKTRHRAHDGGRGNHARTPYCFALFMDELFWGKPDSMHNQARLRFPASLKRGCCVRSYGRHLKPRQSKEHLLSRLDPLSSNQPPRVGSWSCVVALLGTDRVEWSCFLSCLDPARLLHRYNAERAQLLMPHLVQSFTLHPPSQVLNAVLLVVLNSSSTGNEKCDL